MELIKVVKPSFDDGVDESLFVVEEAPQETPPSRPKF
jgi:hypothetical protein